MKLVPLLVGNVSETHAAGYADVFQEYWNDSETFWIISSDFCHWYVLSQSHSLALTRSRRHQGNPIQPHTLLPQPTTHRQSRPTNGTHRLRSGIDRAPAGVDLAFEGYARA